MLAVGFVTVNECRRNADVKRGLRGERRSHQHLETMEAKESGEVILKGQIGPWCRREEFVVFLLALGAASLLL